MSMLIVVSVVVSFLSLVIFLSVKRFRASALRDEKSKIASYLLLLSAVICICDLASGGNVELRIAADMCMSLLPCMVLTSSLWKPTEIQKILLGTVALEVLYLIYVILALLKVLPIMTDMASVTIIFVYGIMAALTYFLSLWMKIYEIRELMKAGTVWSYLCQCVDSVYLIAMLSVVIVFMFCCVLAGSMDGWHVTFMLFFLWLEIIAICLRIAFDSAFVIFHKHERVIVESMKISQVEIAASGPKDDEVYRDIYERVLLHFEIKKPFLDNNLTINDVVSVVYSNKVYISKAISHYTGRNFRQFVNYYRVMYSMDLFRKQPDMKVAELASMSGFNSLVSYASAFRLFMNETPSEWCRKERTKIIKMKK